MSFVAIIPARYASTRLLGKPLADIEGSPMVGHAVSRALQSGAAQVIVATDHSGVAKAARDAGNQACMTSSHHSSGTERLAEATEQYGFDDETVIVNVQGDEPLLPPLNIRQVARNLESSGADMSTLSADRDGGGRFQSECGQSRGGCPVLCALLLRAAGSRAIWSVRTQRCRWPATPCRRLCLSCWVLASLCWLGTNPARTGGAPGAIEGALVWWENPCRRG